MFVKSAFTVLVVQILRHREFVQRNFDVLRWPAIKIIAASCQPPSCTRMGSTTIYLPMPSHLD
ncbi:hypothetical protein CCR75_007775 [Bremia lactucae]|uniref:Uncharacterized protein n=1 Tax=Bremia lactucae TaxID=4779 RepID=A0A976NYL6_BRELC|nr:hypothetical protein CCR75_007775 [Bremia lactucae]